MSIAVGQAFLFKPCWDRCKDLGVRRYISALYAQHGFFHVASFNDEEVIGTFPVDDMIIQSFDIAMEGTSGKGLYRYVFIRSEHEKEMTFITPITQ